MKVITCEPGRHDYPVSPVTGRAGVRLVDRFAVSDIIAAYRRIGLDVAPRFADLDWVPVFRCGDTGYRFFFPHELAGTAEFYQELQHGAGYYAEWRWEHGQAAEILQSAHRILEIGAGTGNFLARMRADFHSEVMGLELNPDALVIATQRGLTVQPQRIEEFVGGNHGSFDAICSFQVLEHVPDVRSFLTAACTVLKPGGKLILGVPNNNPYLYRYDRLHALNLPPHHMGLWNRGSLGCLPGFFPLQLIDIRAEPLDNTALVWSGFLEHIRVKCPRCRSMLQRLPWRVTRALQSMLRMRLEGRNLLAVFERRAI